jgi:hypothetical protein
MTSNSAEPAVHGFWDLSTRHITLEDAKLLLDSPCLDVYEHECGWAILVPQEGVEQTLTRIAEQGHSEAFRTLLRLAHDRGIRMIRFDRDGELVAGLSTFS